MRKIMCCLLLTTIFNTAYSSGNADVMDEYVVIYHYKGRSGDAPIIVEDTVVNGNSSFMNFLVSDCRKELIGTPLPPLGEVAPPESVMETNLDSIIYEYPLSVAVNLDVGLSNSIY